MSFPKTVGSEVGFYRNGNWGGFLQSGFGVITKVNGYGHITVVTKGETATVTRIFDKYGQERGTNFGVRLCEASFLRDALAAEQARRDRNHRAKELQQKVNDLFGYSGNVHITNERKAELKALIDAL